MAGSRALKGFYWSLGATLRMMAFSTLTIAKIALKFDSPHFRHDAHPYRIFDPFSCTSPGNLRTFTGGHTAT